ncbi:hypothetical protein DKT68_07065 [Micromonospora acroterricola]|uniref:Lipoprotein with Yx(FWY)xxD motif n=1 Tax=Micromonospora acroterricola TaxID=2202421 RepID=A0A317D8G0_9ACTN|nr:hypothetical protein [Micromonospora acroterricola]PWR11029.1 hypothetical protein DKT68_07065 [Micromonospora acroterricola]
MKAIIPRTLLGSLALSVALASACTTTVTDPVAMPQRDSGTSTQQPESGAAQQPEGRGPQNVLGRRSPDNGYWPASVQLGDNPELGPIVLDGQGFTLYRFDRDSSSPSQSNCTEGCLMEWLPVLVSEKIKFENLDPAKLGAMARPDGTQQVTVGGWPVYRYADDKVPGQISGQGADGLWFVVAPDGAKAAAPGGQGI